jgi:Trk K+ transport system NAD-binding subunit
VIRKGDVIAPNGNTVLQAYDEVLAVLHTSERAALARLLGRS